MTRLRVIALILLVFTISSCKEEGDKTPIDQAAADRGALLARDCTACHALDREKNKIGPHLLGIVGRQVGSVAGYDYSRQLTDEDREWDKEMLVQYIVDPTDVYYGTKMVTVGLNYSEVEDVVEYLRSLSR